jgi:2-polyprenyl-3-methyl-5-hydroxy-6-metoxy-1,4-benzoquinol methylase
LFSRPLLSLKGMPKAAQYFPEKSEFKKDKGLTLNIYQCSSCGLVQLNSKPVTYYREVITATSFSEKTKLTRLNQIKDLISGFNLSGGKVLEIGCGKGEMLDVLAEAGLRAVGIEASSGSVESGLRQGRAMVRGYIGDIKKIDGNPFEAFVSFNYLEHLPFPGRIIERIRSFTVDNAVGFVTVPNLDYLLETKCFYEFVPDHLSYFTGKTLAHAFERNGFEVLDCRAINENNDIAAVVRKRRPLGLSCQFSPVDELAENLRQIVARYKTENKKIAVWGAGHRTLALLALSRLNGVDFVVDSAKFKQGRFTPVLHLEILAPECLKEKKADLVIVMVPGLYPDEVLKSLGKMNLEADVAVLRDNKIEFVKEKVQE